MHVAHFCLFCRLVCDGVKHQKVEYYQNEYLTQMYFYQEPSGLLVHWRAGTKIAATSWIDRLAGLPPTSPELDLVPRGLPTPPPSHR